MVASLASLAVAATSAFSLISISSAQHIASATYTGTAGLNKPKNEGCYSNSQPLENHGPYKFQSLGNCQAICVGLHKPVLGLTNGDECWCGDKLPALEFRIDDSHCDTGCTGYDTKPCGGYQAWLVYTSGWSLNDIPHLPANQVTSKSKAPQTAAPEHTSASVITEKDKTVTVHAPAATTIINPHDSSNSSSSDVSSSSSGGTNTTAVVAGVVIGIVVLTALVAGVYFWLRRKRRAEMDEKTRQEAAVAGFMEAGRKAPTTSSSMNDFRLDPDATTRRQSSGSIADNEDFSRRILQVTNPDRPPKAFRDSRY